MVPVPVLASLDSVTAGKVLSAVDSDILRSGPSTLKGELQTYGEGKEITLPSGNKHTLQAADLEAIATELGGDASSVANMEVIGLADKNGDVSYYAVHTDATTGKQTGIAMDLDDAGGAFTAAKTAICAIKDLQKMEELNSGNGILKTMDAALAQVDSFRSGLGAVQNRFNSIISNLNTTVNNMTEAKSRILDADFSSEVSAMSRANILQSAGITVLSQANQVPQNVLQLLR